MTGPLRQSPEARPRLLDLFCGAGGAARGYQRAGFYVVGVDIKPQPRYAGDEFRQADASLIPLDLFPLVGGYDVIHASPPCQWGTAYARRPNHVKPSPELVGVVRAGLDAIGLPYVIEQPPHGRRVMRDSIQLCGSSFGLDVRRHRLFQSNVALVGLQCEHDRQRPRFPQATNRTAPRSTVEVGVWRIPLEIQRRAMGIDWMNLEELSEAIPPAYTEFIGSQLLQHLELRRSA